MHNQFFSHQQYRYSLVRIFICILLLAASNAFATTCTGTSRTVNLSLPSTVNVPRDATVGRIITAWLVSPAITNYYTCTFSTSTNSGSGMFISFNSTTPVMSVLAPDGTTRVHVWPTNLAGVGVAFTARMHANNCGWAPWGKRTTSVFSVGCSGPSPQYDGAQVQAALVKTGPISGGYLPATTLGTGGVAAQDSPSPNGPYVIQAPGVNITFTLGSTTIVSQTCMVTTPNISVTLTPPGGLPLKTFTGIGSTSAAVPFSLGVDCSGVSANVYATLTDQQTPGNRSTTLNLSSTSTARGVGIQILNGTTPVRFGPDSSVARNAGQFFVFAANGAANSDITTVNLTARYVQTTTTVTAGSAIGLATFTMSYQ